MSDIDFTPVKRSDTLDAVAFFPEYGDLLIRFKRNGATYRYRHADAHLADLLIKTAHPWSKFRAIVQELEYEKVSSGLRTEPLKSKRVVQAVPVPAEPVADAEPKVVTKPHHKKPAEDSESAPKVVAKKRSPRVKFTEPVAVEESVDA